MNRGGADGLAIRSSASGYFEVNPTETFCAAEVCLRRRRQPGTPAALAMRAFAIELKKRKEIADIKAISGRATNAWERVGAGGLECD